MEKMTPDSGWTALWPRTCRCSPLLWLQKYIRLKRVKVNGKGSKRDVRLETGDMLQLYINDEFFDQPNEENALSHGVQATAGHCL